MELEVRRRVLHREFTKGSLYVNGYYFCATLEPPVKGSTLRPKGAIPYGSYGITMRVISPKYSKRKSYDWCRGVLPRLLNVPGFEGVLIHAGNTVKDTEGCLLVGQEGGPDTIENSMRTLQRLYPILKEASEKETITITYVDDSI